MAKTSRIEIPFPILRLLLPADGELIPIRPNKWKKNKWQENKDKGPFFTDEMVELTFGRKIRAKEGDRKKEIWWKPGIQDKGTHVALRGGWRVHKSVPMHEDFFDGRFTARMTLALTDGLIVPKVAKLDFVWNKSVAGSILDFLTLGKLLPELERKLENQLQTEANKFLGGKLRKDFDRIIRKEPKLQELQKRSKLSSKGTTIVVTVQTD
ncbi:MAG: hypothetical protein ACE5G1_02290 [bacterium]